MRARAFVTIAIAAGVLPLVGAETGSTLVLIRAVHDGAVHEGSGIVVAVDAGADIVHVLTAGALFRRSDGERSTDRVDVVVGGRTVVVAPVDVRLPMGELTGVALVSVRGTGMATTAATRIDYTVPSVGDAFVITGVVGQSPFDVMQHVQFASSRLVAGDRGISHVAACLGSAAVTDRGVFGVVSECRPGRAPIVTLVSTVRGFLSRHLGPSRRTSELRTENSEVRT